MTLSARKRRRDDDGDGQEEALAIEEPRPRKSSRKFAKPSDINLPHSTPPPPLPPTSTNAPALMHVPESQQNAYTEGSEAPQSSGTGTAQPTESTIVQYPSQDVDFGPNGESWTALAQDLGAWLNRPDAFGGPPDLGSLYFASPNVGAFFNDNSLVSASSVVPAMSINEAQQQRYYPPTAWLSGTQPNDQPTSHHELSTSSTHIQHDAPPTTVPTESHSYTSAPADATLISDSTTSRHLREVPSVASPFSLVYPGTQSSVPDVQSSLSP